MTINLRQQVFWSDPKGIAIDIGASTLLTAAITFFFYRSIYAFFPVLLIGGFLFFNLQSKRFVKQKRENLIQFKECIQSVATNMKAGYAVENAFVESEKDMISMFGMESRIVWDLRRIRVGLMNHIPLEKLLQELADRSGEDEVREFADVFFIAKRGGGNLPEIIGSTCTMIGKRIELEEEISVYLASKKMQQSIMDLMPLFVAGYMELTNPGYFKPLYHNMQGIVLMTIGLGVYFAAYLLSEKILEKAGR